MAHNLTIYRKVEGWVMPTSRFLVAETMGAGWVGWWKGVEPLGNQWHWSPRRSHTLDWSLSMLWCLHATSQLQLRRQVMQESYTRGGGSRGYDTRIDIGGTSSTFTGVHNAVFKDAFYPLHNCCYQYNPARPSLRNVGRPSLRFYEMTPWWCLIATLSQTHKYWYKKNLQIFWKIQGRLRMRNRSI